MNQKRTTDHSETSQRSTLSMDSEFRRFLTNKRADSVRTSETIQSDIDAMMAVIEGKRLEQSELDDIVARCDAALVLDLKANRPAPQIPATNVVKQAPGDDE